ncbi:MAG: hypothetical protein AAF721_27860 [Myxococcota bacterium]
MAALAAGEAAMAADGSTDHTEVVAVRERLESVSEGFARRRMERALLAGMERMSLSEVENTIAADDALDAKRGGHEAEKVENP